MAWRTINARILFLNLKIANGRYNGVVCVVESDKAEGEFGEGRRRDVCGIRDDAT